MSTAALLNTTTVNFQDLLANGKTYKVPIYQRDYSWTQEEWEDLWEDIKGLRDDPKTRHYMGAMVVEAESDRDFMIIDGQQRMATLVIFSLAVIARLKKIAEDNIDPENNLARAEALRSLFIGAKNPSSLVEVSKLALNEHDNGFFQDYLVQLRRPSNPRGLRKSNKLLWECFLYFEGLLASDKSVKSDGLRIAELLSETIARQLMFILITVSDEMSAYTVFETLNARGLELTTTDLLKNYLFSRLKAGSDLNAVQRRWALLVGTVRQERFAEFLRYHYLTSYRTIRSSRLYKIVRDDVRNSQDVIKLLNDLDQRAELFDALTDSTHGFWAELPEAKKYIRELNLFRVRQMTPLLFATYEKFAQDEFVKVLRLVSVVSFRYTVVSGLNTNELEPNYSEAAKSVLSGEVTTARGVFEKIRSIYVPDNKFEADFAQLSIPTSGPRRRTAKYILAKLESDASGRECDPETDPATIEHILPENPSASWDSAFSENEWEEAVFMLGNLTLLEATLNREVGNADYADKLLAYEKSSYALTNSIPAIAPEEWTFPFLLKRQSGLAKRAVHLWRTDFN